MDVFDIQLELPGVPDGVPGRTAISGPTGPHRLPPPPGYGFANYDTVFRRRMSDPGLNPSPVPAPAPPSLDEYLESSDELVAMMDASSVVKGVFGMAPNDVLSAISLRHPTRIMSFPSYSPHDGMRAVAEFTELVAGGGASGLSVGSLYDQLPASDRRYYPFYAKCVELDVPVRIYTGMTYANDRAYDLGHPRHLDTIAVDFPELRIVAGASGWPWISETVALVRRHPNLYIDTGSHRPKYLGAQGAGWESLLRFGNSVLQDKVIVGLSWMAFGTTMQAVIDEYGTLPLKPEVLEKWLYSNAATFFRLESQ